MPIQTDEIDAGRRDKAALIAILESAGTQFRGHECKCPICKEKKASAGIYETDGVWKFKCHSAKCGICGDLWDIKAMIEAKPLAEVLPKTDAPRQPPQPKPTFPNLDAVAQYYERTMGKITNRFAYTHPVSGETELVVLRIETPTGKTFRQASPTPRGWILEAPPAPRPLYNRARVAQSPGVIVVEGEKCVHALHELGFVATTSPCGAKSATQADWTPLAGKTVWLWPDNDLAPPHAGVVYMREVQQILERLIPAPQVHWIDQATLGLPDKGDVVDFLAVAEERGRECQINEVQSVLDTAIPQGPEGGVHDWIEGVIADEISEIAWPWPNLSRTTHALMPGTVTLLCSAPGATKSFLLLEAAQWWHENQVPIAIYELEEDRTFHLMRALAQTAGEANLTDMEWIKNNPGMARQIFAKYKDFLASFGSCIWEEPSGRIKKADVTKWIEERAKEGKRIIAVDPYTAAAKSKDVWIEDADFIVSIKKIAKEHGCSIIIVVHPAKGSDSQLAGGADFSRLAQTVLWLEFMAEKEDVRVLQTMGGPQTMQANRQIFIEKARNGKGTKSRIAFEFDPETLTFNELGIVAKKKKPAPRGAVGG